MKEAIEVVQHNEIFTSQTMAEVIGLDIGFDFCLERALIAQADERVFWLLAALCNCKCYVLASIGKEDIPTPSRESKKKQGKK